MQRLKADLHVHCADDAVDLLKYSAEMLIDAAAKLNVNVLAITGHESVPYSDRFATYARERGVLLIPAIEALIEGKHVVILNPDADQAAARTFDAVRILGRRNAAFLAPHPYYPIRTSLGRALIDNIDVFDAIECCALYFWGVNPNRKAERVAKRFGLPMLGTTDSHSLPYQVNTFSWVEAEPTVDGIVQAIRDGRVQCVTRRYPTSKAIVFTCRALWGSACENKGNVKS